MSLKLYNTLSRQLETFVPQDPDRVTMYVCGPTVYNYVHIGNARGPVVFGVLAGLLRRQYPQLVYARNITDVDDKINAAASEQGVPISTITDRFAAAYRADMAGLGITPPDIEPHATTHIPQIIAMIERLIAAGHAYAAEGHVLFAVGSFAEYGQLSRRSIDDMLAGARVEVAPYKRDPGDFVLWKPSTPDLPGWDSPWGVGRPGWHIECSAMAEAHLGETIDIHAGGVDLQFPHHENEVAQSTCAHGGKVFARYWLHNGMLNFGGAKMSKSLGNVTLVHDLLQLHAPEALRYALLSAHYRQPLDWSDALIEQSVKTLDGYYGTLRDFHDVIVEPVIPDSVESALCDDLNTPLALAALSKLNASLAPIKSSRSSAAAIRSRVGKLRRADGEALFGQISNGGENPFAVDQWAQGSFEPDADVYDLFIASTAKLAQPAIAMLLGGGALLGLLQQEPGAWFRRASDEAELSRIHELIEARSKAKRDRDFALADAIRKQLADEGIVLEDTPDGVRWSSKRS